MKETREGEEKQLVIRIELVTKLCEANLLRFTLQAGLYRARPRNRANEQQLSRPLR